MLTTLHLQNFRGFADHAVSFRPLSVIVGPNNGGKSTVIEALRLVAEAIDRIPHGRFGPAPEKFQRLGMTEPGVLMTPEQLGVRPATLFHRYTPPPAEITATFSSGTTLSLWMASHDALLAVLSDHHGRTVSTRSELRDVELPQVRVLPQIRPLEYEETTLKGQYVLQCLNSHLASRHFRNQLRFLHEHFPAFVRLFQSSWSNVRISAFDAPNSNHGDPLALMINEDGCVHQPPAAGQSHSSAAGPHSTGDSDDSFSDDHRSVFVWRDTADSQTHGTLTDRHQRRGARAADRGGHGTSSSARSESAI